MQILLDKGATGGATESLSRSVDGHKGVNYASVVVTRFNHGNSIKITQIESSTQFASKFACLAQAS